MVKLCKRTTKEMFDRLVVDFNLDSSTGLPTPNAGMKGSMLKAVKVSIDIGTPSQRRLSKNNPNRSEDSCADLKKTNSGEILVQS